MYKNGDEFTLWGCDNKIYRFQNYGFFCIKGNDYADRIEGRVQQGQQLVGIDHIIASILSEIKNNIKISIAEVGIIFHPHFEANSKSNNPIYRRWGEFVEAFKGMKGTNINSIQISFIEDYSSAMARKDIYEKIEKLCTSCRTQERNCEELIKKLWEYFSKEKKIEEGDEILSRLQHRIMNLFLPLDIDWQGIKSVLEEDRSKAEQYFDNVKGSIKRSNLLKLLWFYLAGEKLSMGEKINDIILPDKKSIYDVKCDIINNTNDEKKKRKINDIWQEILIHVGLKQGFTKDSDSNFVKYLEGIENQTIDEFLSSFTINEKNYNFHTWYLKLGELLDELKKIAEY
jgi:hypothetical protein